ncbi:hypothetical protein CERSUDRAFT_117537 [Gelatoporia subvermispora B]|uniref:Uncharacterized protein n=1 Tax=Ceriporiopsis subvermispora (strain B) TaxID=914234 RepID=M2PDW6_CERS8|nr:hypothetical protein CERSUDRAFT_117537 [Gelatoporia subvermispora B]
MPILSNVLGFSLFGLASRLGQLSIEHRKLTSNPAATALCTAVFGYAGYWAWRWDERAAVILAEKRAQIEEHKAKRAATAGAQ